jgi:hypothetical protein
MFLCNELSKSSINSENELATGFYLYVGSQHNTKNHSKSTQLFLTHDLTTEYMYRNTDHTLYRNPILYNLTHNPCLYTPSNALLKSTNAHYNSILFPTYLHDDTSDIYRYPGTPL